jgi:hypothetical protein
LISGPSAADQDVVEEPSPGESTHLAVREAQRLGVLTASDAIRAANPSSPLTMLPR